MKLNLWISLPLSMMCAAAIAQTSSTTTTTVATTSAPAAVKPATASVAKTTTTATTTAATSTTKVEEKKDAPSMKYGFTYGASYTVQAQQQPEGVRSQGLGHDFTVTAGYGDYNSFATMSYSQDLVDTSTTGAWSDPVFGLSKKAWKLNDYLKLGPSMSVMLPNNDATRNDLGLLYNAAAALKLSLDTKKLGMDSWSFAYQLGFSKNFLKFDTNAKTNSPNRSHRIRNRFDVGYNFTDTISLFNRLDFDSNYSVNGVLTNAFSHFQSLGYQINDNVSASFTHGNSGSYLKAATYENNLKFFDSASSEYTIGLEVSL